VIDPSSAVALVPVCLGKSLNSPAADWRGAYCGNLERLLPWPRLDRTETLLHQSHERAARERDCSRPT
jgi:hypothetical protein